LGYRAAVLVLFLIATVPAPAVRADAPPPAAPAAPVSVDELQSLVDTLQDDAARARLVAQLQALIAAQRGAAAKTTTAVGPALFDQLSQRVDALTGEILAGVAVVIDAPRLVGWVRHQITDPAARRLWSEAAVALAVVFGTAFILEWLLRLLLGRLVPRLPTRRSDTLPVRSLFALLSLVLDALPILVFTAVAYSALVTTLDPLTRTRITLSVLLDATVEARLVLCIVRNGLVPTDSGAVFVPLDPETRNYLYIWIRRFVFWVVFGYAVPEAAWWLGAPGAIYALMLNVVGLILALLTIIFILQNRAQIGKWIAGSPAAASGWGRARRVFAEVWLVLAVLYISAIYLIYALRIQGGFVYVARATLLTLVVIVAAHLLVRFVQEVSRRGFAISPELKAQFPTLEQRANRYLPILTAVAGVVVYALAGMTVLQAWNIGAFAWLGSEVGRRVAGNVLSIGVVLVVAIILWETVASAIERYLTRIDASQSPRRTRVRTLLPLFRTAVLCVIVVLTSLIVLSHIGIDIAPLLAGAGVVGVAIGFGSQALVKDIITGLFILMEDQIAIGDVVDVGKEHRGVVEAITVRTIRLRDQAGTVHTVPFSEVTSVKNLTRDFGYAVARIGISYSEDIDRVVEILRQVSHELMEDEELRPAILDPFDYQGVDALEESCVVLLVRVRTVPSKQLAVGRAFNRLVKIAFDKHGVSARDPASIAIVGAAPELSDSRAQDLVRERRRA
jgi:moderate conductance mechanosensitive channel